jgi:hypothetical protein
MTERKSVDWEAIEREYRAGQLSASEIGRQHGVSRQAILKRAKKECWPQNLSARVKEAVAARVVADGVAGKSARETVELAAERGVQIVREHRASIGRGQRLVSALFAELEEATENQAEIEAAIEEETADDNGKRRAMMLRALALPSRAAVIVNLSNALRTFVGLERQAFNLGDGLEGNDRAPDVPVTHDRRKAALALLLAKEPEKGELAPLRAQS